MAQAKPPIFGIASWCLPSAGILIAFFVVRAAEASGELLAGYSQLIISIVIISLCAFVLGLTALVRRERFPWLAVLPTLLGLSAFLYIASTLHIRQH